MSLHTLSPSLSEIGWQGANDNDFCHPTLNGELLSLAQLVQDWRNISAMWRREHPEMARLPNKAIKHHTCTTRSCTCRICYKDTEKPTSECIFPKSPSNRPQLPFRPKKLNRHHLERNGIIFHLLINEQRRIPRTGPIKEESVRPRLRTRARHRPRRNLTRELVQAKPLNLTRIPEFD